MQGNRKTFVGSSSVSVRPGGIKLFMFRFILCLILCTALEIIGYLGMWVNSRSFDFLSTKHYFRIRAALAGDSDSGQFPRYLSVPYLGYIPYPGYKKYGITQHNQDGYRGQSIPLQKTGKYRILCMGGSTTYGFGVDTPDQTYPARLGGLADSYIKGDSALSRKYRGAEVINAGLEGGTSAEELEQYMMKYKYYYPDMVIINSGGNDAMINYSDPDYQLDYTHYRRLNFNVRPLPPKTRWMLYSNFLSFWIIYFFYDDFENKNEFNQNGRQKYCHWTTVNVDSMIIKKQYALYPFYSNHKALITNIREQCQAIADVTFPLNPFDKHIKNGQTLVKNTELNNSLIKSIAIEENSKFINMSFDSIPDVKYWVDDCHLTVDGEKIKARIIFNQIKELIH